MPIGAVSGYNPFASSALGTMDSSMDLARSSGAGNTDYKGLSDKDKANVLALQQDDVNYEVTNLMYDQDKKRKDEWAESFGAFAGS